MDVEVKNNKYEKISLTIISLLVIKTMLLYSKYFTIPNIVELIIEVLSYGYILFIILTQIKISPQKLIIILFISLATVYTGFITKSMVIFSSFLILCLANLIDKEKMVKVIFRTIFIVFVIHIVVYSINLFFGNEFKVIQEATRKRYYLGFTHPNISGTYALWCFVAYAYLNRNKTSKIICGFLLLVIIYIFNQTRTMLYCSILLCILILFTKIKGSKKIIRFMSKNIFTLIAIFMCILTYMYMIDVPAIKKIDEIMSYRLFFSSQAINNYGLTIFGQRCDDVIVKIGIYYGKIIMDVTYTALLYHNGVIYLILLILLTRYTAKNNSTFIQILVIVWSVFALFELYSLNFVICFPLLFGADWIGGKKSERNT